MIILHVLLILVISDMRNIYERYFEYFLGAGWYTGNLAKIGVLVQAGSFDNLWFNKNNQKYALKQIILSVFQLKIINRNRYQMQSMSASLLFTNRQLPNENSLSSKTVFPLKRSSTSQIVVVKDQTEEMELLSNLVWRQNTSMPVVKVLSFKNQGTHFPKSYTIDVEYIERSVKKLEDVDIRDCLYLLQQCLLGVQALHYKYHQFDFHQIFYGITQTGQSKVWINQQLTKYRSEQLPLPKQDIIIGHILKMIMHIANCQSKKMLSSFMHQTAKITNLEYSQFHIRLNQFANRNKILIPPYLSTQTKSSMISNSKSEIVSRSTHSLDNGTIKINFRYQSPIPKSICQKNNNFQNSFYFRNQLPLQNRNPRLQFDSSSYRSQNPETISYQFISRQEQKPKDVSKMLCSPNRLKQRLKHSKNNLHQSSIKSSITNKKQVKQLSNQNKSEKTCTSLTMNNDNDFLKVNMVNRNLLRSGTLADNKWACGSLVVSSTNFSQGFECAKDSGKVSNTYQGSKEIKNNQLSENQLEKFLKGVREGAYNFGGLLPLPEVSVKHSQYLEEQNLDILQETKPLNILKEDHRRKNLQSLVLSQTDLPVKIEDWGWQNKMSKLLSSDDSNLKQSVYCGEQKKPEPLQIKLQMLGKLGRQITSMIPQTHEH